MMQTKFRSGWLGYLYLSWAVFCMALARSGEAIVTFPPSFLTWLAYQGTVLRYQWQRLLGRADVCARYPVITIDNLLRYQQAALLLAAFRLWQRKLKAGWASDRLSTASLSSLENAQIEELCIRLVKNPCPLLQALAEGRELLGLRQAVIELLAFWEYEGIWSIQPEDRLATGWGRFPALRFTEVELFRQKLLQTN